MNGVEHGERNPVGSRPLSGRLRRVARLGTWAFVLANALVAFSVLTNQQPVPYWPWLSLPVAPLPTQPRLGHYPLSYTLGLWLWEFTFPLSVLWGVDRLAVTSDRGRRLAFVALPAVVALAFHAYCRFVVPQPTPSVWEPAVTAVCYVYCQTYAPLWSAISVGTGALGLAGALAPRDSRVGTLATVAFGLLAFPLGVLALYEAATRRRGASGRRRVRAGHV